MYKFQQKLKNLKEKIKQWNRSTFSNIFQVQHSLEQAMQKLQQRIIAEGRSETIAEQERQLQMQISERVIQA